MARAVADAWTTGVASAVSVTIERPSAARGRLQRASGVLQEVGDGERSPVVGYVAGQGEQVGEGGLEAIDVGEGLIDGDRASARGCASSISNVRRRLVSGVRNWWRRVGAEGALPLHQPSEVLRRRRQRVGGVIQFGQTRQGRRHREVALTEAHGGVAQAPHRPREPPRASNVAAIAAAATTRTAKPAIANHVRGSVSVTSAVGSLARTTPMTCRRSPRARQRRARADDAVMDGAVERRGGNGVGVGGPVPATVPIVVVEREVHLGLQDGQTSSASCGT